jgi:hypothetical protein
MQRLTRQANADGLEKMIGFLLTTAFRPINIEALALPIRSTADPRGGRRGGDRG